MDFWNKLNTFTDMLSSRYTCDQIIQRNNVTRRQLQNFINSLQTQSQFTIRIKPHLARKLHDIGDEPIGGDSIICARVHAKKRESIMRAMYRLDAHRKKLWTSEEVAEIIETVKQNQSDMHSLIKYLNS